MFWFIILILMLLPTTVHANQSASNWCMTGNQTVSISGLVSSTKVQQSFPACTITVYLHGSSPSTLATIYSDNSGTPLANPFTANSSGYWQFYAAGGRYDVVMSGAGFPSPTTLFDLILYDPTNTTSFYVTSYYSVGGTIYGGAACNGTTDDAAAINGILTHVMTSGGTLQFPPGAICLSTSATISITNSHTVLEGNGSELLYNPPSAVVGNDRAIAVFTGNTNIGSPVNLGLPVITGATSANVTSTAGINTGDWLVFYEIEPAISDVWVIDWVQVSSISGSYINTYTPFRKSFPGTHSTPAYVKVTNPVNDVTVRDLRCVTTSLSLELPCFTESYSRNVRFINDYSAPALGNAFYSYRGQGFSIFNSTQARNNGQTSEIAETVDVQVIGNTFGTFDVAPNTAALSIDMGTGPFSILGNSFQTCANICMEILDGPIFGQVALNTFGYTGGSGVNGISMIGVQNTVVAQNGFMGGAGSAVAINDGPTVSWSTNIPSKGNVFGPNVITNFTSRYGTQAATNAYIDTAGANQYNLNGPFNCTVPTALTCFQATLSTDSNPHLTINSIGTLGWSDGTTGDMQLGRTALNTLSVVHAGGTTDIFVADKFGSATSCASAASPAACGTNSNGAVVIATGTTSVVVDTTVITAGSQIFVFEDSSLGTQLSTTCNTTAATRLYSIIARSPGTSFTIQSSAAPSSHPACLSFIIIN